MQRQRVNSSDIFSVGYDANLSILEIEFNSGGIYRYSGVSSVVHAGLMGASSHGTYFHQNIKDAYSCTKIT